MIAERDYRPFSPEATGLNMKLLFVCSRNRLRSPTAEAVFSAHRGVEATSAGTSSDADTVVSPELIEWADIIFPMEPIHRRKLLEKFGPLLKTKRVIVLGIPDRYKYMDSELITVLKKKVLPHIR
jgi:predicted protein tyrosine phosphatase